MECLPCFESTSPERAKSLSRAHLVRSRPPKIVPLCERQLYQIKYLSTEVIHKAQGLYTGGRNLGHTSSARHVFSVSSPQRIFPCWWSPTCFFSWSWTTGRTQHHCCMLFSPQVLTSPNCCPKCDLISASGSWGVFVLPGLSSRVPSHHGPFCPGCPQKTALRVLPCGGIKTQCPTKRIENHHKGLEMLGNLGDRFWGPTTVAACVWHSSAPHVVLQQLHGDN